MGKKILHLTNPYPNIYHLNESTIKNSGRCFFHGTVYPVLNRKETKYSVIFRQFIPAQLGPPGEKEVLLGSDKIPKKLDNLDLKSYLNNVVYEYASKEARRIAEKRGLELLEQEK